MMTHYLDILARMDDAGVLHEAHCLLVQVIDLRTSSDENLLACVEWECRRRGIHDRYVAEIDKVQAENREIRRIRPL